MFSQIVVSSSVFLVSLPTLLYAVLAYSHARVLDADLMELEQLHAEGLLDPGTTVIQDFETISYLLGAVAPAVYMRQEMWIKLYYYAIRIACAMTRWSEPLDRELRRLTAYQACHYRTACARLAAIRAH